MEALKVYGKDYLSISNVVGTRDVKQVKSHAQKFMQMLKKSMDPKDSELLEALTINLRVLKHSERNTYRGGQVDPNLLNYQKQSDNLKEGPDDQMDE